MKILPINDRLNKKYSCPKIQNNKGFTGLHRINNAEFNELLDYIVNSKQKSAGGKKQEIKINGIPTTYTIIDERDYVLKSKDNQIKAYMNVVPVKKFHFEYSNKFYTKNSGAVSIEMFLSKGNGAGSFLIKEAVKLSKKLGFDGRVVVYASPMGKSANTPIPFYHKMGFRASTKYDEERIEKAIREYNKTGIYTQPLTAAMYLDEKYINRYIYD